MFFGENIHLRRILTVSFLKTGLVRTLSLPLGFFRLSSFKDFDVVKGNPCSSSSSLLTLTGVGSTGGSELGELKGGM